MRTPVSSESDRRLPDVWPGWLVSGALPLSAHPAYQEWGHGCRPGGKLPLGQHSASLSGLLLSVLSTSLTSPHSSLAFLTQAGILYSGFLYSHFSIDFPSPASFQRCFLLLCNKSPMTGWLKTTHVYYLGVRSGGVASLVVLALSLSRGCRCGCALSPAGQLGQRPWLPRAAPSPEARDPRGGERRKPHPRPGW